MNIRINAKTAVALVTAAGRTLEQLKAVGRVDLSSSAFLVAACDPAARRRVFSFTLCEVGNAEGAHLADFVEPADRELLPVCHQESWADRQTNQQAEDAGLLERTRQERFRQLFFSI